jgi:hypothetical protein
MPIFCGCVGSKNCFRLRFKTLNYEAITMCDILSERLLTLPETARLLPGHVHVSTIHRWRLRGAKGIKLETVLIGGRRYTSREAVARFAAAVTAARDGLPPLLRTPKQREKAIAQSERELKAAGI